jgi:parvulin-like peptidyl-prolyl isomerase
MKRFLLSGFVLAASAVAGVAAQAPAESPQVRPVVLQKVLVKVNGAIFTKTELEALQVEALQEQEKRNLTPIDVQNDAKLRQQLLEITPAILGDAIDQLIVVQRGKELGLRMSEAWFKEKIEDIKKQNQLDDKTFEVALKQQGMTIEELRKRFEIEYYKQGVSQREVAPRVSITEEEARQYYRAHPEEFMTPTMITVREITVLVPGETRGGEQVVNAALDEAASAKVKAARERALKGEDFTKLVAEFSESSSKANGGLIGPLNLNELAEGLQKILGPLKTGDVAEPIRTPTGYQLLKVETKDESGVQPFEKVRQDVAARVTGQRGEVEMGRYLDGLREQAIIEWKDDELKKLYEQYRATQKKGF